jgi:hypothetical protein
VSSVPPMLTWGPTGRLWSGVGRGHWANKLRGPLTLVLCLAAAVGLVFGVNSEDPILRWIGWDYLLLWLWQLLLCISCLSAGRWVLKRLIGCALPALEEATLSMALGVVLFVLFMYAGGALGLFSAAFAVALPLSFLTPSVLPSIRFLRRAYLRENSRPKLESISSGEILILALGVGCTVLLYLQCMTPDSIHYDATWTHLTIAQDFSREGRIVPFLAETAKNLPHLASILYTWDFLLPGISEPAFEWMAAQHTELLLFGWTIAGIGAAAHWIAPSLSGRLSWVAFFLFPGFFVYDSNLGGGSDHVAAFFAVPFLLTSGRALESFSPRLVLLAGIFAGAALQTKFQCLYLVAPVALVFSARWLWFGWHWLRSRTDANAYTLGRCLLWAPLLFVGGAFLSFGPHALTNWIFYRNPLYPMLLDFFPSEPYWSHYPYNPYHSVMVTGDVWSRLSSALRLSVTFSFDPQYSFIGKLPFFGSLFTLLTPLALFHLKNKRLWLSLFLAYGALFCWASVFRSDRNLQLLLPWLVVVTASLVELSLRSGLLARWGMVCVLTLQGLGGARFIIAGGHERMRSSLQLIQSSFKHNTRAERYRGYRQNYQDLGESLPKDARVLIHTAHVHLGLNRNTISDWAGWQFLIDYRTMQTPRDLFLRYRELGITHIVWNNHDFPSIKQEDVLFHAFVKMYAKREKGQPGLLLWSMPAEAPASEAPYRVATWGLSGYKDGIYDIRQLSLIEDIPSHELSFPEPLRAWQASKRPLLAQADALIQVSASPLNKEARDVLNRCFENAHTYYGGYGTGPYSVYVRKKERCPREELEL